MESVRGGLIQAEFFSLSLSSSLLFLHFAAFRAISWFCGFFPLLDDILKLLFGFQSSRCASLSLGFKIQTLFFLLSMHSSRGRLRN
jgi:hypothetical protein